MSLLAVTIGPLAAFSTSSAAAAEDDGAVLDGPCLDSAAPLSVEESRLDNTLPRNDDPSRLQSRSFAETMIDGAGFQRFGPAFVARLCETDGPRQAQALAKRRGERLWRMAVSRAQGKHVRGSLPAGDDRPVYWTRLQATAALRQWSPDFPLSPKTRAGLVTTFDKASRGMDDIDFPAGDGTKRLILSGFDPYTLDGGKDGSAEGATGNNIRHGNPSGAAALAMDGTRHTTPDGTVVHYEAYTLPVNYPEFERGYLEDTVGPYMRPGPRQVDASVTMSQYGGDSFKLEEWNGRYHGVYPGNDNVAPCPERNGAPQLAVDNHDCNIRVVTRWGGPPGFVLHDPPQWTTSSLPMKQMIEAHTGRGVPRPPGDTWKDGSEAFGVIWHTNYVEFPDCTSPETVERNTPVPTDYPPPEPPRPPDPGSCSYSGGGGNYLSNESAYRNTLLRDRMGLDIPAGHIHTPGMQHFATPYKPSDATFDTWRQAIVDQGLKLVDVVADHS